MSSHATLDYTLSRHVSAHTLTALAKRIVIKVGTNVVMRDDGRLAVARLHALAESIATLHHAGRTVVIVSSGAVGLGAERLQVAGRPTTLAQKQACAAVGQGRLMAFYADAFDCLELTSAQILLTEDDFVSPERRQNLCTTLIELLHLGVIPIINENDTVSTFELERSAENSTHAPVFGDNDHLSALIATSLDADLLILLSNVDGLFTANPIDETDAEQIAVVEAITPALLQRATGKSTRGRGGMTTKLEAARIAVQSGVCTVIANGHTPGVVEGICSGATVGTVFLPVRRG